MLLRVDDVVQAVRKNQEQGGGAQQGPGPEEMMEQWNTQNLSIDVKFWVVEQ